MTETTPTFETIDEARAGAEFVKNGYVIREVEDRTALDQIRGLIVEASSQHLGAANPDQHQDHLDNISSHVGPDGLNDLRLSVINEMRDASWFRAAYYALAREMLSALVGNELAMQKNVNLSIQLPGDDSSLLPVHADVLNGDSPFEVVLWVPLVDCHGTKSMYLLSSEKNADIFNRMNEFASGNSEDLFDAVKDDLTWLEVPYGSYLLFSQNLLHGNRVNEEAETRWSMNCRFKSLFSPYADKKFGEFFEPITMRPATRLGLRYQAPGNFGD